MIGDTDEALEELDDLTENEENIGVDELGVTTILLEVLSDNAGQDQNVSAIMQWCLDSLLHYTEITVAILFV